MCTGINDTSGIKPGNGLSTFNPAQNTEVLSFTFFNKNLALKKEDLLEINREPVPPGDFSFDKIKKPKTIIEQKHLQQESYYRKIDNTRTMLDQFSKVSSEKYYSEAVSCSDGVLAATRGLIGLAHAKTSENRTRTIFSSVSNLAGGVGTLLMALDIPEAEFFTFPAKLIGVGLDRQDLGDNIRKKDTRGIVGTSVSISKSVWGAVVSGAKVTKAGATLGEQFGLVSHETVGNISETVTKFANITDKIAIPFAVIGTGLSLWDWRQAAGKANKKEAELKNLFAGTAFSAGETKLSGNDLLNQQTENQKELKTLKINSNLLGFSFAASAISTSALIATVASPSIAVIMGPVSVTSSIISSVLSILADDKTRDNINQDMGFVVERYDDLLESIHKS
jgi:hypothetical protein